MMLRAAYLPLILLAVCVLARAQDPAPGQWDKLEAVLPYLSSGVPEHRLQAEKLVEAGADANFDKLVIALPSLPRAGREILLRILTGTQHKGRVLLCLETLCDRNARRAERTIASRALSAVDGDELLALIEKRLAQPGLDAYQRVQCCTLIGTLASARAQGVAEAQLAAAGDEPLSSFAAEDAVLRSTIEAPFAQPAWARYQSRNPGSPLITLRELQDALDQLALPRATDRAMAELALADMLADDARVLLALARSPYSERAAFALKRLEKAQLTELALAAQAVMLDLVMTSDMTIALMAMDVAIAGVPPTDAEMQSLRPVISIDAEARLESILEGMGRGTDLAELRAKNRKLEARLRPLLQRRSGFDTEVRSMLTELEVVKQQLEGVEALWEGGWRREFETEILGIRRE